MAFSLAGLRGRVGAQEREGGPATWLVLAAFAAVYIIWGSTYLAIHVAVETLPPFLMAGARFLFAGGLLFALTLREKGPLFRREEWLSTLLIGGLLLLGGNGGVVWAAQRLPSGLAALIVALVPLWMVLVEWGRRGGVRPTPLVGAGVVLGLLGIGLLVGPGEWGGARPDLVGVGVLMLSSFSWAFGSILSGHLPMPAAPLRSTAMQMLGGGLLLTLLGAGLGEGANVHPEAFSQSSLLALLYLVIFGSLIGFTAYAWLLRVRPPEQVATYAYVNPVVAVFLGWLVLSEPLTPRTLLASTVIISSVALVTIAKSKTQSPKSKVQSPKPE